MNMQNLKGQLFVLLSAVLFGSYGIWAVLLGSDFGVFFQGYVRSFLVLLILVSIMVLTNSWKPLTKSDMKAYAWCCGFGIFTQAPLYYAFQHAGVGIVSLVFACGRNTEYARVKCALVCHARIYVCGSMCVLVGDRRV